MKYLLFLFLVLNLNLFAQITPYEFEAPDYNEIKKSISKKKSEFYYPSLLARWKSMDTTLEQTHFLHLYYGYVFQDTYAPYYICPFDEKLKEYMQKEQLTNEEADSVLKYSKLSIDRFPFDLRKIELMYYANRLKGDTLLSMQCKKMLFTMINTILSTGDGKDCATAFHVISISHEYYILSFYGFEFKSQALIDNCDYLELKENEYNVQGIYFNVEQILENAKDLFK